MRFPGGLMDQIDRMNELQERVSVLERLINEVGQGQFLPLTGGTLTGLLTANEGVLTGPDKDVNVQSGAFVFSDAGPVNVDHIWHDDGANTTHFVSDNSRKAVGNSTLRAGALNVGSGAITSGAITASGTISATGSSDLIAARNVVAQNGYFFATNSGSYKIYLDKTGTQNNYINFRDSTDQIEALMGVSSSEDVFIANYVHGRVMYLRTESASGSAQSCIFLTDGSNRGRVRSKGTYDTTAGAAGDMNIVSDGTFYRLSSSLRYKKEVEPLEDWLADKVLELEAIWYRGNTEGDIPEWSFIGFGAEQAAGVDRRFAYLTRTPDCDCEEPEGGWDEYNPDRYHTCLRPEDIQVRHILPALQSVVKRQRDTIQQLTERLSALERKAR